MWGTRQILMAALLALLGAAAWWLLEPEQEPQAPPTGADRRPDYVISDFTAVETDGNGRPNRELKAKQLRQYVDEDLGELDLPKLKLHQTDGPPWHAESRRGLLLAGGDEVVMMDQVQIRRAADRDTRPVRLDTAELTIWPKRQYAQGDQPVRIESARDWLTASGLLLWYAKPARAEFPGRARLYIAPAAPTESTTQESPE